MQVVVQECLSFVSYDMLHIYMLVHIVDVVLALAAYKREIQSGTSQGHYYAHYNTVRYRGQDVVKGSRGYFNDGQRVNMVNAPPKGQESRQQSTLLVDFELVKLTGEIQKPMLNNHNHNR